MKLVVRLHYWAFIPLQCSGTTTTTLGQALWRIHTAGKQEMPLAARKHEGHLWRENCVCAEHDGTWHWHHRKSYHPAASKTPLKGLNTGITAGNRRLFYSFAEGDRKESKRQSRKQQALYLCSLTGKKVQMLNSLLQLRCYRAPCCTKLLLSPCALLHRFFSLV